MYPYLPPITPYELEEIKCFISFYRRDIIEYEILILDRLISSYQKHRTHEIRQELKKFLIYLRRSVCPSPPNSPQKFYDPERITFDQSLDPFQLQEDYIYSKTKLNPKESNEVIYECTCKSCKISTTTTKPSHSPSKIKRTISILKKFIVRTCVKCII
uniref:Maturase K n=1 Tax=Panagrolaimus sp. ES5 TaxID=591445 RepID=A0AC34FA26_9BILA